MREADRAKNRKWEIDRGRKGELEREREQSRAEIETKRRESHWTRILDENNWIET